MNDHPNCCGGRGASCGGDVFQPKVLLPAFEHEIRVQRSMIADMQKLGWQHPCGRDPNTGEPLTLVQSFGRYATALAVLVEWAAKGVTAP